MLNDFISSFSAQVTISQEVTKWLKKPAQVENFEISFFQNEISNIIILEYYHFW